MQANAHTLPEKSGTYSAVSATGMLPIIGVVILSPRPPTSIC